MTGYEIKRRKVDVNRGPNFTQFEKNILIEIIEKHKNFLETKKTDVSTVLNKKGKWLEVEEEFNSTSGVEYRSYQKLKKCWENMKYVRESGILKNSKFRAIGKMAYGNPRKKATINDTIINIAPSIDDISENLYNAGYRESTWKETDAMIDDHDIDSFEENGIQPLRFKTEPDLSIIEEKDNSSFSGNDELVAGDSCLEELEFTSNQSHTLDSLNPDYEKTSLNESYVNIQNKNEHELRMDILRIERENALEKNQILKEKNEILKLKKAKLIKEMNMFNNSANDNSCVCMKNS